MSRLSRRLFVKTLSASVAAAKLSESAWGSLPAEPQAPRWEADLKLWFDKPAEAWVDALPVGNGRLGAMVFGGQKSDPAHELLQLNETTLWSGRPHDGNNPHAKDILPAVRTAVLKEKNYHLADELCRKMQGKHTEAYQPFGDLSIKLIHDGPISLYRRELDLDTACAAVSYAVERTNGQSIRFKREIFSSGPDDALVVRLTSSSKGALNGSVQLTAELQRSVTAAGTEIVLSGKAPAHWAARNHPGGDHPLTFSDLSGEGMFYAGAVRVLAEDGDTRATDTSIEFHSATSITLLLCAATGYRGFQVLPDTPINELKAIALRKLDAAARRTYAQLRQRHVEDHQRLFRRMSLTLGESQASDIPTDRRLAKFAKTPDPALLPLYFNYGRYLLIASSRTGSQPANLQGIWNNLTIPPWGSNYTSNINIQMNYWPAETCNLSECGAPLFEFIRDLSINGTQTAMESYGLSGWCAHHNIDLWRSSNSSGEGVGRPTWGNWCMAGPWLCSHLYEHYLFSDDVAFLREMAYPVMRGAAEFCLGWLTEDGTGHLTTCPSESTENDFLAPDGKLADTSAGCTMDIALLRELFANCQAAAKTLQTDADFAAKLAKATERLLPYQVGSHGQLQEWSVDFPESTPGQRHMSHLYPLFPGNQITPHGTPELARACRVSLERRLAAGGAYTGWSRAWAINLWARLGDGDRAWESLSMLLLHSTNRNLFDLHPSETEPIFQIDGNFGATAAVAEMLLQSHAGSVDLLPALPSSWPSGSVRGLRARGGLTVDMAWTGSQIKECTIVSSHAGQYLVRSPHGQRIASIGFAGKVFAAAQSLDGTFALNMPANSRRFLTFHTSHS